MWECVRRVKKSNKSFLIEIPVLGVGLGGAGAEGDAEAGALVQTPVGLPQFRLIQFVLRQHQLLQVLDHVHCAFVLLGLRVGVEELPFCFQALDEFLPLVALGEGGGGEVDAVGVGHALGLRDGLVDLGLRDGVGEAEDLLQI